MTIEEHFDRIQTLAESGQRLITQVLEREQIQKILDVCQEIDTEYQAFCRSHDRQHGVPAGTTYRDGVHVEWYFKAAWWHEVSQALRELRAQNGETV